ncbi:fatty acid metabolism transcriptional regulator FadR [Mannheimia sp. AT1]|uniref:Fatty acid metabolism regulator protein n=1 Tax=Mannheimia cairinae TaxID=3025936 RepID=A0ABT5MQ29_9PAST|nr:fatty acid metabolism transcriptional regulator FadR [Mannheimia cairinae]MDD0823691.1 fatty acid metabolism transcriptional regulator FadR [Mannheimia cairinae]MDD0825377.1 fatty acid metabolism transcriptional regulator FadR [Mannheimia cairinae]
MDQNDILKAQSPAGLAEEYIVKSIWNNHFPAGSDLPAERELAERIGVTRTTLREVLQRLAREGWLNIQHGKPTRVNNIWETAGPNIIGTIIKLDKNYLPVIIANVVSLRTRMAEAYIPEAIHLVPDECVKLFSGLDELENTAEAYAAFDYQLFRQFTFLANKPVYALILNSFKAMYHQVAEIFFADANNRLLTLSFYRSLLAACIAKDSEKATACMAKNRQSSGEIWRKLSANLPDSFGEL